jgi:hypothetical protein
MSYPFAYTSQERAASRPYTYTTFVEEATPMAGVQIRSQESGFAITTNTSENLNMSADDVGLQSVHNLGSLEEFDMASFGMGEGFADTSPRSNTPNPLSDFSVINDYQQAQHDFSMLDECLIYENTSMPPFPYLNMGKYNNTSDFDCGLNTHPSLST